MKKINPKLKIIYRSHIEGNNLSSPFFQDTFPCSFPISHPSPSTTVRSDLTRDPKTPQHRVWSYLWTFIQHADAFISHPVASFVPDMVPKEKLSMMPATTDLLDGLNKELDEASVGYYQSVFNRTSMDATGKKADFRGRPYVVQIARFDPSKGEYLVSVILGAFGRGEGVLARWLFRQSSKCDFAFTRQNTTKRT